MAVEDPVVLWQADNKLAFLAEIPAVPSSAPPAATFRLLVEQAYRCADADAEDVDVDTMEDVTCRVPFSELRGHHDAVDLAFGQLVASLDNPMLRPEVAPEAKKAAARVRARCAEESGSVEFRLRVVLVDTFEEESESGDEESRSDLEFDNESDLDDHRYEHNHAVGGGGGGDDDGAQFLARPYDGPRNQGGEPSDATLLLSGFEARSDGPELAEQHELTSRDMHRLLRLALNGGSLQDDEAYQRALAAGTPVSRATRAALLDQALLSAGRQLPPSRTRGRF